MSANEDIAQAATVHAVDLKRYDAKTRKDVLALLVRLEKSLIDSLRLSGIEGDGPAQALTPTQRIRAEQVLKSVTETIRTAYRDIDLSMVSQLSDLSQSEGVWLKTVLDRGLGVNTLTTIPGPNFLRAIASDVLIQGAVQREWWERQAGDLVEKFSDAVRQGMVAGETNSKIIQRIRGTRAAAYKDGVMEISRRNAAALVQTSVQSVANAAQLATARENSDVVKGVEQISTLDSHTTVICVAYSGKTWDLNGKPIGHKLPFNGGPPRHFNCRSILVPLLKSFLELGVNRAEIPPSTRASLDGQVPADMTFQTFLEGKSKTFQDDMLGVGKADLWRDGKITLTGLLDQKGRPLTLEQLKKRH